MIAVPAGVRVLVAAKPVDFRKGGDGLAALGQETLDCQSGSSNRSPKNLGSSKPAQSTLSNG